MDKAVHREARDKEAKGGIDAVDPCDNKPCNSEVLCSLCAVRRFVRIPLGTTKCAFGLVCGGKLDDVGNEEMTGNK